MWKDMKCFNLYLGCVMDIDGESLGVPLELRFVLIVLECALHVLVTHTSIIHVVAVRLSTSLSPTKLRYPFSLIIK